MKKTITGCGCMVIGVLLAGCTPKPAAVELPVANTLVIFHNNSGSMCLEALDWLAGMQSQYSTLVVEQHDTRTPDGLELLRQFQSQYASSQGFSTNFGYLPIIFFRGQAFSGFNDEVESLLAALSDSSPGITSKSR